jgi:hypothetical protein
MRTTLVLLGLLSFPLPALLTAPAAPPAPGPGGVIAMHRQLFAAIDAGDAEQARAFVTQHQNSIDQADSVFYLPSREGEARRVEGVEALADALARMARESAEAGGRFETRITYGRDDCRTSDPSYAILEFERTHERDGERRTERFRSTSLVQGTKSGWKLFHWHVSRVDPPAKVASAR